MPMPAKGPHLALRRRKGREPVWVIRDTGRVEVGTGSGDRDAAEIALARYIAAKHTEPVARGPLTPDQMTVEAALLHYLREHVPEIVAQKRQGYAIKALKPFWGHLPVSAITKETCRAYAKSRVRVMRDGRRVPITEGTVRRELQVLQAAVNHCAREVHLTATRSVHMPAAADSKQRALTRSEAARLLWAARKRGDRHVMRFVLIGLYTGTRSAAILSLRLDRPHIGGGWFDLEKGVLHRKGAAERETNKRRPAARLPRQLLAHARRWRAMGDVWAVHWQDARVGKVDAAFRRCAEDAKLGWRPTPHTLKHTAVTWAFEAGMSMEDAVGYFATSWQTLLKIYRDCSPHWQANAVAVVEKMGRRR